jgi:2-succinyl-6-hydroxy-2,4-cyclohexadiene-1-carboxylate synthase
MESLSDRYHCIAVDLPGHGKTQLPELDRYYTIASTARGLIGCLDALQIEKCHLVGYSMGGRLALYLALHFPDHFIKVVLESASPGLKTLKERMERMQSDLSLARELETKDFSAFLMTWYGRSLFASIRAHPDFERLLVQRSQNSPLTLARSLRKLSTGCQPSLWKKLKQNKIPLLLLVGELDAKFTTINAEMADLCQFAKLAIVRHCGHNIHFENANLFAQEITYFLDFP